MKATRYFKMLGIVQWQCYIPNTRILSVTVSMMQFVNMFEAPLSETFLPFYSLPVIYCWMWAHQRKKGRVHLRPDGTWWCTGGEVKGKLANGVGSQYSHTTSEHGASSITNTDAHTSAASSRLNRRPRQFKWTRLFRRKTKSGFCACAITFQTQSTESDLQKTLSYNRLSNYALASVSSYPMTVITDSKGKGRGKVHPRTRHVDPEWE